MGPGATPSTWLVPDLPITGFRVATRGSALWRLANCAAGEGQAFHGQVPAPPDSHPNSISALRRLPLAVRIAPVVEGDPPLAVVLFPAVVVAALLFLVAGAMKLADPEPVASTLYALGIPAARPAARVVAWTELALGIGCLLRPSWFAPAAAGAYLGLAAVVAYMARNRALAASCACIGADSGPPTPFHAVLNCALAAALVCAWIVNTPSLPQVITANGWIEVVNGLGLITLTWMTTLLLVRLR